jgi:hypothetical protein
VPDPDYRPPFMQPQTVRFDDEAHRFVAAAAGKLGISAAQFIRESSLIRAALVMQDVPAEQYAALVREIADRVQHLAEPPASD